MLDRRNWTREETIIAFNLYCKIPFKDSRKTHPLVVEYAGLIGRSPSALNMKIGNIGRLDPDLRERGITGLAHGARLEIEIWEEFAHAPERLAFESEEIIARLRHTDITVSTEIAINNLPAGEERLRAVRQRVNQGFFRSAVMSAYNFKCCISGTSDPKLVEACHIVDWATDEANRTNPKNGLCLNPFFHKAYDKLLIGISPDLQIVVSDEILENTHEKHFQSYLQEINGSSITLPDRFLPQRELLDVHYRQFLNR